MASTEDTARFREMILELMREKGVSPPSIPESSGRQAYLDFVSMLGYSEDDVLPLLDRSKVTGEMRGALIVALMKALESDDKNFVRLVCWMALNQVSDRDNTNILIYEMSANLAAEIRAIGGIIPDFYAGVFPTDTPNAQATVFNSTNLVLIDTGYMETLEAAVVALMAKDQRLRVGQLAQAVNAYVEHAVRPDPTTFDTTGINFGGLIASRNWLKSAAGISFPDRTCRFMIRHHSSTVN